MLCLTLPAKKPARVARLLRRFFFAILLALAFLLGQFALLERRLRPLLAANAEYECRRIAMMAMEQAIDMENEQYPAGYGAVFIVQRSAAGNILSVETDTAAINQIQAELGARVEEALARSRGLTLDIPLGTLTGVNLLTGRGAAVSFPIEPSYYVTARIYDTIESSAINQTKLNLYVRFTVEMNVLLAGSFCSSSLQNELYLGSIVVMGQTPQAYLTAGGGAP